MATTANQLMRHRNAGSRRSQPAKAAKHFYEGTLAYNEAASGYLTDVISTNANKFRGIVISEVDNSGGASGEKDVELYTAGEFVLKGAGLAQTDVGKPVYGVDNDTISTDSTDKPRVGTITEFISTTRVAVEIDCQG
jgi:hypothetical protein